MPRVKIDTPGVTIEIDANEASVAELSKQALELFRDAGGWPRKEHSSFGFGSSAERRWTPDHRHDKYRGNFEQVQA